MAKDKQVEIEHKAIGLRRAKIRKKIRKDKRRTNRLRTRRMNCTTCCECHVLMCMMGVDVVFSFWKWTSPEEYLKHTWTKRFT